jgi:hypothetical protein
VSAFDPSLHLQYQAFTNNLTKCCDNKESLMDAGRMGRMVVGWRSEQTPVQIVL